MNVHPTKLPLVIGVTGHADLAVVSLSVIRTRVTAVLRALRDGSGCPVVLACGMARGADLVVAAAAAELDVPIFAVLALPRAASRAALTDDSDAVTFDRLLDRQNTTVIELPALGLDDEAQYEQLGAVLARRCHMLLALWDGDDTARALRGGTAHVVHMARSGEQRVPGVLASPLFPMARFHHSPERQTHVLQIATPRAVSGGMMVARGTPVAAGDCVPLWGSAAAPVDATAVWDALDSALRTAVRELRSYNAQLDSFEDSETAALTTQVQDLHVTATDFLPAAATIGGQMLQMLRHIQAAADVAAQRYQRRLLGVWVPAAGLADMCRRARSHMRRARSWWAPPGMLSAFAAAVPLAVLAFELYAHALHTPWGLAAYATILLGSLGLYRWRVRRGDWQNRFQDYRSLAEALRVQLFMALAGLPVAAPDHYLRRATGNLGWIRLALQGPALWALALSKAVRGPQREVVRQGWLADQMNFFIGADGRSGRMRLHGDAARKSERNAERWGVAAVACVAALCLNEIAIQVLHCTGYGDANTACRVLARGVKEWLIVATATAPAVAAFFVVSAEKRGYEAHAHAYRAMGDMFAQALRDTDGADDDSFRDIVLEVGREALAENADWLLDHRRRRIDYTPGA